MFPEYYENPLDGFSMAQKTNVSMLFGPPCRQTFVFDFTCDVIGTQESVAAEGIFEWGANQFARAPELAGPHLGAEGHLRQIEGDPDHRGSQSARQGPSERMTGPLSSVLPKAPGG